MNSTIPTGGTPDQRKRLRDMAVLNSIYEYPERRITEQGVLRILSFYGLSLSTAERTLKQWETIGIIKREGGYVILTGDGETYVNQGRRSGLAKASIST